eukprot:1771093-Pyramimonas_sp.AAC.1
MERLFRHVWHERTVAKQLSSIRRDRDLDIWESVKDIPSNKRKREQLLHSKSGPQLQFSTLFARVWDVHWRARLDSCRDESEWYSHMKDFVRLACDKLNLPQPHPGYVSACTRAAAPRADRTDMDYQTLPLTK